MASLYLIPTPINIEAQHTLPEYLITQIHSLDSFVAERAKTARAFLKHCKHPLPMKDIDVKELDKHAKNQDWEYLMGALSKNKDLGFMSEAGCPGVADPGAEVVNWAHKNGFRVIPLVGPSSILLALMASGMDGQNFCFNGYLPNKSTDLKNKLKALQNTINRTGQTQIFIETPYRNNSILNAITETLDSNLKLALAIDLTGPREQIVVKSLANWKKLKFNFPDKIPCIFILGR